MNELFGMTTQNPSVSVLFLTEEEEEDAFSPFCELVARVHRALSVREAWALSPVLSCEDASPALLPTTGELGVMVPWSRQQGSGTSRRSGADVLALFGLHAAQTCDPWAPPPITTCLPLSRLGGWSSDQATLGRLLARCPGWDGFTRSVDAEPRWVVVRSPQESVPVQAGIWFGRTAGLGDAEVFGAYLVAVLQRLIAEVQHATRGKL